MEITSQVSHVSPWLDIGNQEILTSNRTLTTLSTIPTVENYGQRTGRSLDNLPNEILGEIFPFVRLIGRYEEETYGRPVKGSLHLFNITRCSSRFYESPYQSYLQMSLIKITRRSYQYSRTKF